MEPLLKRNRKIIRRYLEIGNFSAVGREFGLSTERIRQIYAKACRMTRCILGLIYPKWPEHGPGRIENAKLINKNFLPTQGQMKKIAEKEGYLKPDEQ